MESKADSHDGSSFRKPGIIFIIVGAAAGTVFEWYDFFLYGSIATVLAKAFFSGVQTNLAFLFALCAFAAGFAVRPFGSLVFGRLGDLWGRKNTFLVTMLMMGVATIVVGLLPTYASAGVIAPVLLIAARLVQGLAVGGEYGGAAIYVAEHAARYRTGLATSFIQLTCTLGLFLSLAVVLVVRISVGETAFASWGWRLPFIASTFLMAISLWIRVQLQESPVFQQMVSEGTRSKRPGFESFLTARGLRKVLIAVFGLTAGMTATFYCSQLYAQFFLERVLKVSGVDTNILVATALLLACPFFVIFGWLSDHIGRKPIILAGCLLATFTYFPLFKALTNAANPKLAAASATAPVRVTADPADCSFQLDLIGKATRTNSCDIAKATLANAGISYSSQPGPSGSAAAVQIAKVKVIAPNLKGMTPKAAAQIKQTFEAGISTGLVEAGYPSSAASSQINRPLVVAILFLMVFYVTMTYGPLAAALVELFPASIRYTSLSVSYNVAVGWLGGFLAPIAYAMVIANGNIYYGLWYPVALTALTLVVGLFFYKESDLRRTTRYDNTLKRVNII